MQTKVKMDNTTFFPLDICASHDDVIDAMRYCTYNDILNSNKYKENRLIYLDIEKVIFNHPATIIFWTDGTKTIVKCSEDDVWDPEKGIAMAIVKKFFSNTKFIKKLVENSDGLPRIEALNIHTVTDSINKFNEIFRKNHDEKGGK